MAHAPDGCDADHGPLHPKHKNLILAELKGHAPFTAFGALTGMVIMGVVVGLRVKPATSQAIFHVLHPAHVLLSAIVTAGLFRRYKKHLLLTVVIGYFGSVGIGTLSDIIVPHVGGMLVGAHMGEQHADEHEHDGHPAAPVPDEPAASPGHEGHQHSGGHIHIGFIDHWWLVNPLALLGIALAIWKPWTKLPHWGHVFLSTWASLFYLTGYGQADWIPRLPLIFGILFVAVWFPCCLSDIIFPLLFVGKQAAAEHVHDH